MAAAGSIEPPRLLVVAVGIDNLGLLSKFVYRNSQVSQSEFESREMAGTGACQKRSAKK